MELRRLVLFFYCASMAVASYAADTVLPPGQVFGGIVEDDGRVLLVLESGGDSLFVRLKGDSVESFDLPGVEARSLAPLADGDMLLASLAGSKAEGNRAARLDIVDLRGDQIRYLRSLSVPVVGYHYELPAVSGDGRIWALEAADGAYTLGRFSRPRMGEAESPRFERVALGERVDLGKWEMGPDLVILDSDGPVVLSPWSEGAYILHFSEDASSPYILPVLFGDSVEEYEFRWQWKGRVLWARSSLYWKAYHLWDLGLSPFSFEEPYWVVEKTATEPHPLRGVVRVATKSGGGYRIEHVWRDPWSSTEGRRVSAWYQGEPPSSFGGLLREQDLFVSPNGRHAVVVEKRTKESADDQQTKPAEVTYARRIDLSPAPPTPSIKADSRSEAAEDRAHLTLLRKEYEAKQREEAAPAELVGSTEKADPDSGTEEGPPIR